MASYLAKISESNIVGNGNIEVSDVSTIQEAESGDIAFLDNSKYYKFIDKCNASVCIVSPEAKDRFSSKITLIVSKNPYLAYAKICNKFFPNQLISKEINKTTIIDSTSNVADENQVEPYVVIKKNVTIGSNNYIGSFSEIGPNVSIGKNCYIYGNVNISNAYIGNNVIIQSGVRIGQDGFGFALSPKGHTKVPQVGYVSIGNDVEIGVNCTIDKGSKMPTMIGNGVKLDNLIHIAHNVTIGDFTVIAGQTGVAGSSSIGKSVIIGGQVGVSGHITIGDGCQIGAQSGVTKDIKSGEKVSGTPAVSLRTYLKQAILLKKMVKKK